MIWYLCVSTVRGDRRRMSATSFIVRPSAIRRTTSRWRGVSVPRLAPPPSAIAVTTSWARLGVRYVLPRSTVWMAATSSCPAACFTMKPEAPARRASAARSASACMVRKITRAVRPSALRRRSASSPLIPGMARSLTMTSGLSCRAALSSCCPSATVPTRENVRLRRVASPSATTTWSSASRMVGPGIPGLVQRHHDPKLGAALMVGGDGQTAPGQTDALVEADEAQPRPAQCLGEVEPGAVVRDGEQSVGAIPPEGHPYVAGPGVLGCVAESFLRHAVEAEGEIGRHIGKLPIRLEIDGEVVPTLELAAVAAQGGDQANVQQR